MCWIHILYKILKFVLNMKNTFYVLPCYYHSSITCINLLLNIWVKFPCKILHLTPYNGVLLEKPTDQVFEIFNEFTAPLWIPNVDSRVNKAAISPCRVPDQSSTNLQYPVFLRSLCVLSSNPCSYLLSITTKICTSLMVALTTETLCTSETSVNLYETTWHNIPHGCHIQQLGFLATQVLR